MSPSSNLPTPPRRFPCLSLTAVACFTAAIAIAMAGYFAGVASRRGAGSVAGGWQMPIVDATSALTSEKFSMATGEVSDDVDGLFVLDHNSGLLQCSIVYPRVGQFMGQFVINVADAIGGGKGGQYLMITGSVDFPRSSNRPAASTVVYVLDTSTGNYACFGVPFDRTAMNANRPQNGTLVLITTGTASPIIDRDRLR